MKLEFFMPMAKVPTATGQERGVNRKTGAYYEHDDAKLSRAKLRAHLGPSRPNRPLSGPIRLTVKWCFPETKTHPAGSWKTSWPDTDNLLKLLKDEMTYLGYWKDDAQVCSELSEKFYWEISGVFVRIEEIGDGDHER